MPTDAAGPQSPRTLAATLRCWDDDALADLVLRRPDLARPAPADLRQLAARAAGRGSVAMAVDRLDTGHLAVLEALALLREPVGCDAVARAVHAAGTTVRAALHRLRSLALVWGADDDLRLVRSAHDVLGPTPAGLGPRLATLLAGAAPAHVRALASDVGVEPTGDPVTTAARVAAAWSDPRQADRMLAEARAAGGPDVDSVLARLVPGPPTGRVGRVPGEVRLATAAGALEQLLARGALVRLDGATVSLPREVGLHLRGGRTTDVAVDVPPQVAARAVDQDLIDRVAAGTAFETVRRVELLLDRWADTPPAVLRSGGVGLRDLRAAAELVGVDDDETGLLVEIARAAGLLGPGDDPERDEVWLPTDRLDPWRDAQPARRWTVLATAWLATPRATVLVGGRDERDRPVNPLSPDLERGTVATVRRATVRALAEAGGAVDDPEQVVARVAWHLPRRAVLRDASVRRTLLEAGRLGITAMGALSAAGRALLDDATGAADPAHGVVAADRLAPLLPRPVDHVVLQADLTAVAPGPLLPDLARGLDLLADVESRGGATVYRFSASSVRRALDAGWPASQVHAFLAAHSRTPVPQPLGYLVDDAARRHGRLRLGPAGVYLRADDPAELDTLEADTALAPLQLHRLAPTVAVTALPADVVLARLRGAGRAGLAEGRDGRSVGVGSGSDTGRRARPAPVPPTDVQAPGRDRAVQVVHALRAGERARGARPPGREPATPTRLLDALRTAADEGGTVWLAYLDDAGTVSERVVDPVDVDNGRLTAYDHRSARRRSFALHRISHVAAAGP